MFWNSRMPRQAATLPKGVPSIASAIRRKSLTGIVANLERAGLMDRKADPDLGRIIQARRTKKGAARLAEAQKLVDAIETGMLSRLKAGRASHAGTPAGLMRGRAVTHAIKERSMVHIVLLRAINVAGHKPVAMAELRAFFEELGFEAQTLLQSGNLIIRGGKGTDAALETRFEKEAARRLNLSTDFFVRSASEWKAIVADNPFRHEAKDDPSHLVVMPLKDKPTASAVKDLQGAVKGKESIRAGSRHLYITYPDGIGRSKLTGKSIETALGTRGTGRNWNTVLKLAAAAQD